MTTLAPTLSTRYIPRTSPWIRDLGLIVAGSLLMAALAQVIIPLPFTPVPITGQTFGVLLIGAASGSKRGAASMFLYIIEGALGLPFFAGGASGGHVLIGTTAGYLVGFVVAAYVIGLLAERGLERSVRTSFVPFFVGTLIIYLWHCMAGSCAWQFQQSSRRRFVAVLDGRCDETGRGRAGFARRVEAGQIIPISSANKMGGAGEGRL